MTNKKKFLAGFLRKALVGVSGVALTAALSVNALAVEQPKELRLDYAYYSPTSLVLKKFGWAEEEFKADGVPVKWILSAGSNRALEYLNSGSVDFGSTAGLAAVLSKANGNAIKGVYVYSQPEWTALVVPKDSPIKSIKDLKGKKVSATKGTDPYLFLLRSLHQEGLSKSDIEHVSLQHADGRAALEQGRVDAWAGLDPLMATSELEKGSRLIYRNVGFNTYGFLNTNENFARQYPDTVKRVIKLYEKARLWVLANPEEAARLLAEEAKLSVPVAKLALSRNIFNNPRPGAEHVKAFKSAASILLEEELVRKGTDLNKVIDELVESSFANAVIK